MSFTMALSSIASASSFFSFPFSSSSAFSRRASDTLRAQVTVVMQQGQRNTTRRASPLKSGEMVRTAERDIDFRSSYNVTPSHDVLAVRYHPAQAAVPDADCSL